MQELGDESNSFQYQALDTSNDSFRLIRVLPNRSTDDVLQLSIEHAAISSAEYRCLSYRWGSHARNRTVLLNDRSFAVGENLYCFLNEVSSWIREGFDGLIWIDSICIDQDCVLERGHQVQRMGSIYSGATEVYIWLGAHTITNSLHEWLHSEPRTDCPEYLYEQWKPVRIDAYWYRAWIVQEILLAQHVTIVFPQAKIDWAVLGRAIARSGDIDRVDDEAAAQLWTFWHDRWVLKARRHQNDSQDYISPAGRNSHNKFWSLIHMHSKALCIDRRDRIYSLLGLVWKGEDFHVDYDESLADLFWRAGEYFDAWEPELVDILRMALFQDENNEKKIAKKGIGPGSLISSLQTKPNLHVRIPVRRATSTSSIVCRLTRRVKCRFGDCQDAPQLQCRSNDVLLCTNARSDGPTEHGCIHGLAHPTDKPAAEPFEIRLFAHHGRRLATTVLPPTALQVYDNGSDQWVGISTWSSLQAAVSKKNLDRKDLVKLLVPAKYAVWIWFGVHPDHLESAHTEHDEELPSPHHAMPPGTKITKDSVEVPRM